MKFLLLIMFLLIGCQKERVSSLDKALKETASKSLYCVTERFIGYEKTTTASLVSYTNKILVRNDNGDDVLKLEEKLCYRSSKFKYLVCSDIKPDKKKKKHLIKYREIFGGLPSIDMDTGYKGCFIALEGYKIIDVDNRVDQFTKAFNFKTRCNNEIFRNNK